MKEHNWEFNEEIATATLCYSDRPRSDVLHVDLDDVRASRGFAVQYDFDRDGWVIMVPTKFAWAEGEDVDEELREIAFVPSWDADHVFDD